ncbi:hypothetical protein [Aminobacter sp. MDW-2]|uniref:hypothetical protein n=1 Tax=Aminobacter sp. MDW-2 TaxID=2666139 RepID=UPI0012AF3465|nr:hypothetical protein [Aminobacter sp. MDW-2]MRX31896.1 hypothetical protein [Aminobacter sp. MDW-2]QNH32370.1 hypothetical protein H5P29_17615 [Aminobacter sp. MDW-2]
MNTLSWLLYAADVSRNLRSVVGGVMFLMCVPGLVGLAVLWAFTLFEEKPKTPAVVTTTLWMVVAFAGALVLVFTPSAKTIYMIAASEAGETVVTSPEAIEMMGDLKAIIKKRLAEELGK